MNFKRADNENYTLDPFINNARFHSFRLALTLILKFTLALTFVIALASPFMQVPAFAFTAAHARIGVTPKMRVYSVSVIYLTVIREVLHECSPDFCMLCKFQASLC